MAELDADDMRQMLTRDYGFLTEPKSRRGPFAGGQYPEWNST